MVLGQAVEVPPEDQLLLVRWLCQLVDDVVPEVVPGQHRRLRSPQQPRDSHLAHRWRLFSGDSKRNRRRFFRGELSASVAVSVADILPSRRVVLQEDADELGALLLVKLNGHVDEQLEVVGTDLWIRRMLALFLNLDGVLERLVGGASLVGHLRECLGSLIEDVCELPQLRHSERCHRMNALQR